MRILLVADEPLADAMLARVSVGESYAVDVNELINDSMRPSCSNVLFMADVFSRAQHAAIGVAHAGAARVR